MEKAERKRRLRRLGINPKMLEGEKSLTHFQEKVVCRGIVRKDGVEGKLGIKIDFCLSIEDSSLISDDISRYLTKNTKVLCV